MSGVTLPDSNALAVELKTSWVDASSLKDPQNYITINAIVPVYKKYGDTLWVIEPGKEQKTTLAMVGIHFVGSLNNHPELVWATFEHMKSTPNAAYAYLNNKGQVIQVPQETGTDWLFNANASDSPVNISHMKIPVPPAKGTDLTRVAPYTISASNTQKTKPFGVANNNMAPNQEDKSAAASNSEVISINNAVMNLLVGNDVRKNYFFVGSVWTQNGLAPSGKSYQYPTDTLNVAIGTSQLANSTMETYFQSGTGYTAFGSCFGCHHGGNPVNLTPGVLSHVYSEINSFPSVFIKPKQ